MTFDYERTAPVRWPHWRHALVWYLYGLADPLFQQRCWVEGKADAAGRFHELSSVIHFFFNDTDLAESPKTTLGGILLDELEVAVIRRVVNALNQVYDHVGLGKSDAEYVCSAHWRDVIVAAQKAYRLLRPRVSAEGDNLLPPE